MGRKVSAELTFAQRDRACGVLVEAAAGDALSASRTGVWSAGFARAITVAELAAIRADLGADDIQNRIVERWKWFAETVEDPRTRTQSITPAVVAALTPIDHEEKTAETARVIAELADTDPDAGDAGVLWAMTIRHAVLTGNLDLRIGLGRISDERRRRWSERIDVAEQLSPSVFAAGGPSAATALQGAWSVIRHSPVPADDPGDGMFRVDHLRLVLERAVRDGLNVTGAAIAGGLLGATYGASAVPSHWRLPLRGGPGLRTRDLIRLAATITDSHERERDYWWPDEQPPPRRHPYDERLWIGGIRPLAQPAQYVPDGVDAIVSLCPVDNTYLRSNAVHLDVRLADGEGGTTNLDFVLLDTVCAVEQLRAEGHTVFLHSKHGRRRAPAVAALYGAHRQCIGIDKALADVIEVWPDAEPGAELRAALRRLAGAA